MERLRRGKEGDEQTTEKAPGRVWWAVASVAVMKDAIQQHIENTNSANADTVVEGTAAGAAIATGIALLIYIGTRDEENPFDGRDLPEALTAVAIFGAGLGATIDWSIRG